MSQTAEKIRSPLFFPDEAPFSPDQKAWISGYLSGLASQLAEAGKAASPALKPIHILYGSQTGNAESVAFDLAENASGFGLGATTLPLDDVDPTDLATVERLLIIVSTYGEGEMPDNAQLFWDAITATAMPRLEKTHYAIFALGDSSYDGFCEAGKNLDLRLEQLGAKRIAERIDCDVAYEDEAADWTARVMPEISTFGEQAPAPGVPDAIAQVQTARPVTKKSRWNRKTPYTSTMKTNRVLSGPDSAKEIRHIEFLLEAEDLDYVAGDALGVVPLNRPDLVDHLITALGADPETPAPGDKSLKAALTSDIEIRMPSKELVKLIAGRAGDAALSHIVEHGDREALDDYLWGKDQLDLLRLHPDARLSVEEYLATCKPLQHRAYSISSSPHAHPGEVHLTVAAVRYKGETHNHTGVASGWIADHVPAGQSANIFMSPNKAFRLPEDPDTPIIMVGPGTGIAPFRAFLADRAATGASGRNWLFFGDQHRAHDFIYEEELTGWADDGLLTRLDLAFSRDQAEKDYVQHRMQATAKELFAWLEEGAVFYVCGDATYMAKDVDATLHHIIAEQGGIGADKATDYVNDLKRAKRYLRDVY